MPQLTIADITRMTMDKFYSDPEHVCDAALIVAAEGDAEMLADIRDECERRGIPLRELIAKRVENHEALWRKP